MENSPQTDAFPFGRETGSGDTNPLVYCRPHQPNIALAGVIISSTAMIIVIAILFSIGRPLFQTLVFAYCIQWFIFSLVLIKQGGHAKSKNVENQIAKEEKPISSDVFDHWRVYPKSDEKLISQRAAIISVDLDQGHALAVNLASLGWESHHCTDSDAIFGCVSARPGDWDLVICDLDAARDPQEMIYDLADFRADCPDVPVLLLSGGVLRDDILPHCHLVPHIVWNKPVVFRPLVEGIQTASPSLTAAE